MLKLIIEDDEGRKTVVPFARDEITIGRQEGNTIRLTERNVSRRHARLVRQSGQVMIEDLGSYNGVKINGDKIAGQVQINDGDLVQIGDYDLAIQREEDKAAAGATVPLDSPTTRLPVAPANNNGGTIPALPALETAPEASPDDVEEDEDGTEDTVERRAPQASHDDDEPGPTGGAPKHQATAVIRIDQIEKSRTRKVAELGPDEAPRLVVMNTDFAGKEFTCSRTEMRIGRVEDNDIALDHRSLSRTHCKVVREENGEWRVIDLQSANGIMVNGETYAQVTLRPGDVLELGHVKLKFLAAGDTYTPSTATAPSVEVEAGREASGGGGSKVPLFAIIATVAVLVLGGGGYGLWKSMSSGGDVPPKKDPVVVKQPEVVKAPETPEQPVKQPDVVVEPPREDPEAARKAADAAVAEAKQAIASGDFDRAELLLKGCKVGDSPCPEARPLLVQIEGEQGFRRALEQASDALGSGDLEKARVQLEAARPTKLLKARYQELEAKRADAVKAKLAEKKPEVVKAPPKNDLKVPPPPAANKTEEAKKLYEEGDALRKEKQWTAVINRMEKCNKLDPTFAPCYRLRGTAHGNLQESELVVKYYKLYLQFAAPDDPMIPKVRNLLKTYEDSLKK